MKWFPLLLMVLLTGCTGTSVLTDSLAKMQEKEFQFQKQLDDSLSTSHAAEMQALEEQKAMLARIEESVNAINASAEAEAVEEVSKSEQGFKLTSTDWPEHYRLVYWTGDPCPSCEKMKPVIERLEEAEIPFHTVNVWTTVDGKTVTNPEATKYKVSTAPQVWIVHKDTVRSKLLGEKTFEQIIAAVQADVKTLPTLVTSSGELNLEDPLRSTVTSSVSFNSGSVVVKVPGPSWNVNGDWNPSHNELLNHLSSSHSIDGSGLSYQELRALHDNAHNGYSGGSVSVSTPSVRVDVRRPSRSFRFFNSNCPNCL